MSLRFRANIVFVLALTALAVMVWFTSRESRNLKEQNGWVSHTRDVLELSELLPAHAARASSARAAYIREGDPAELKKFEASRDSTLQDIAQLRILTADNPEQQLRLTQLESVIHARLLLLKSSIESYKLNPNDRSTQDAFTAQGAVIASELLDLMPTFEDTERSLLLRRSADAAASYSRGGKINTIRSVFVFLFLLLAFWFLNREFARSERAERATDDQKELLQSVLDSCSDSVIVADGTGSIILRNPVAERNNALIHADEVDENYPQLLGLYKGDGKTLFKTEELALARALRGESVHGLEICNRPPGGDRTVWTLAAGGPLLNGKGEKQGGVVFLRDITHRKETDQQLTNALLESETQARENVALSKLGDLLQSCHTVNEAYRMSVNALSHIFGGRPGALCITNASRDLVEAQAVWNGCSMTELGFNPDECWALRLGKQYAGGEAGAPLACAHVRSGEGADYICTPLTAHGETLGVLYVESARANRLPLSEAEKVEQTSLKRRAVAVAERVSLALANLRLRELLRNQSIRDPLTGLFNRRYLEESLNRELHRAARAGRAVSVVMLDLDHFKHFNDTFGHQAGDLLLKEVAALMKSRLRAGDLACRFGGEEFSLILCEVGVEGAFKCMQNICEAIRHLSVEYRGQTLGAITVSAGIANFPVHSDNLEDLIHAADAALYRAKKNGRDCVVIYDGPTTSKENLSESVVS